MEPTILYEDKEVIAINKPSGLVVHSDGKTNEANLVDWILKNYPKVKDVGEPWVDQKGEEILRSGIVHRLDRETSGVMLIAKTNDSFENLKEQFKEHEIGKTYHAFLFGELKTKEGKIDRPIGRSTKDFRMWSAQRGARGKMRDAVTNYKVLEAKGGYTLVEVKPETGRTHQIRVHFKAINYPLVGDSLYAPNRENTLGFTHTALHSVEVTFKGLKGKEITVTAPYPVDFTKALDVLQTL